MNFVELKRASRFPRVFEVSEEASGRSVEVEGLRPLREKGVSSSQENNTSRATRESSPMETRAPLAAKHPIARAKKSRQAQSSDPPRGRSWRRTEKIKAVKSPTPK